MLRVASRAEPTRQGPSGGAGWEVREQVPLLAVWFKRNSHTLGFIVLAARRPRFWSRHCPPPTSDP